MRAYKIRDSHEIQLQLNLVDVVKLINGETVRAEIALYNRKLRLGVTGPIKAPPAQQKRSFLRRFIRA